MNRAPPSVPANGHKGRSTFHHFTMPMRNNSSSGFRHLVPILIILLALTFLLKSTGTLSAPVVAVVWPILLGLIGLVKLEEVR